MNEDFPILIADDDADAVDLLKRALREVGFNNPFHISANGQDVIYYLQGHAQYEDRKLYKFPRILIVDLKMEPVNGFALMAWLMEHEECNVIPRLVLSASSDKEDINRAYQLGINTYLVKPPTYDGLVRLMRSVFEYWELAAKPVLPLRC